MTADSVPAPMVLPRTPGSVVEATHRDQRGLWMLTPLRDWVMSDINNTAVLAATEGLTVHRVLFDAATPAASVPAADILALANEWYPGTPGPRRMTSWARLAYQDCARELRALVDERQPQRCEHGILRRLDCFECNEVADAATPAASVPAAECHEEVTRKGHLEPCEKPAVALRIDPNEGTPYPVCVKHTRADMVPLRALVAAAEQADKGEAADTPRDEGHGSRGWEATETGWRCTECHASVLGQIDAATDAAHRCLTDTRVPVNDEAEAWRLTEDEHKTLRAAFKKHGVPEYGFYNQVVRHIHEFIAARGEDA